MNKDCIKLLHFSEPFLSGESEKLSFLEDYKTDSLEVNVLVEGDVPFTSKTGPLTNTSIDCSCILEDVDSLESFLKVVAPVLMNNILTQRQKREPANSEENLAVQNKRNNLQIIDRGAEQSSEEQTTKPICCSDRANSFPSKETDAPEVDERSIKHRLDFESKAHGSAAHDPFSENTKQEFHQTLLGDDDQQFPDVPADQNFDNSGLSNREDISFNSTRKCNETSLDGSSFVVFGPMSENKPNLTYPNFEEQYESQEAYEEGKKMLLCSQNENKYKKQLLTGKSSETDYDLAGSQRYHPHIKTIQSLLYPTKLDTNDIQGVLDSQMWANEERHQTQNKLPFSIIDTMPRSSFHCASQSAAQQMMPLDFNLNALHIKPALMEEQGAGGDTRLETLSTTSTQDTLTIYDPHNQRTHGFYSEANIQDQQTNQSNLLKWTEDAREAESDKPLCFSTKKTDIGIAPRSSSTWFCVIPALDIWTLR
ncbi:hypothetical protein PoB_001721500 [Plakobranchus ocellatus]|uniref:Uncharacterized protein n=1 Tax=Plakobranchus ocellatus TaxID=259542 RepID=A0AAV3Z5I0_9GAST|nr:hypothetical protein PoB_001721500 [Plakobranchus ocellatus]